MNLSLAFIASSILLLAVPKGAVSVCLRRPDVDCSKVEEPNECESLRTCQRQCYSSKGSAVAIDKCASATATTEEEGYRLQCRDKNGSDLETEQCQDLSSLETTCNAASDCLWADDDAGQQPQGPFDSACNPRSVSNVPGSLWKGSFLVDQICLEESSNVICGTSSTSLGQWFVLKSGIDAPLRLSTQDSLVEAHLSVFTADPVLVGALTCLAHSNEIDGDNPTTSNSRSVGPSDKDSPPSEVVIEAIAGQVYYVLATLKNSTGYSVGDRLGSFKLSTSPATAQARCGFECSNIDETKESCACQAGNDGTYTQYFDSRCERCNNSGKDSFCLLESSETVYGLGGGEERSKHCHRLTKGFDGETVCVDFDDDDTSEGPTRYTVNDRPCTTVTDSSSSSCALSHTFDCSAMVPGAVFNWCDTSQGYEGIFLAEKLVYMDFVPTMEPGQCYEFDNTDDPYSHAGVALGLPWNWWLLLGVVTTASTLFV